MYFKNGADKNSLNDTLFYKWKYSPWVKREKEGFIEFQREGERYRDDTNWWRKQTHQRYIYTYLVDPKTNLIVRSEFRQSKGAPGANARIRQNFRYNVPLKPGVFDVRPPVGKPTTFVDWTEVGDRGRHNRKATISSVDTLAVEETLKKLANAYNRHDWNTYIALRDTRSPLLGFHLASTPEATLRENFEKRKEWRTWDSFKATSSSYSPEFQATRNSENDPFPPRNPHDVVDMMATIRGTDVSGKALSRAARIGLRKMEGIWKVSSIQFLSGKPRRAETPRQAAEKGARAVQSYSGDKKR